jgi:putative FmdB family regulatory protein
MPRYDFECDECGHVEEVVCSMDAVTELKTPCPKCNRQMRRLFYLGGIIFKGDGWPGQDIKRGKE